MKNLRLLLLLTLIITSPSTASDNTFAKQGAVLSSQGGRYVFGQIGDGILTTFMLDTQTGRLWKYQLDEKKEGIVLAPVLYQTLSGYTSLSPVNATDETEEAIEQQKKREPKIKAGDLSLEPPKN